MKDVYRPLPIESEYFKPPAYRLRLNRNQYGHILDSSRLEGVDPARLVRESIATTSYLLNACSDRITNKVNLISQKNGQLVGKISIPYFNTQFGFVTIEGQRQLNELPLNPFNRYYQDKFIDCSFDPDDAHLLHSFSLWNRVSGVPLIDKIPKAIEMAVGTYLSARQVSNFCNFEIISNSPDYHEARVILPSPNH